MNFHFRSAQLVLAIGLVAVAACTPEPVLKPAATPVDIAPDAGAVADGRYREATVVWGGRIAEVRNRAEATEIVIEAFPLDAGQRPQPKKDAQGRFVAVLPGYVESRDYRQGRFISVTGTLGGSVFDADAGGGRAWPLVLVSSSKLWPPGFPNTGPEVHFAVGVSGAIH